MKFSTLSISGKVGAKIKVQDKPIGNFIQFCNFSLSLSMFSKVFGKISVSFGLFRISEILDLEMAKDKKVNIRVTNSLV